MATKQTGSPQLYAQPEQLRWAVEDVLRQAGVGAAVTARLSGDGWRLELRAAEPWALVRAIDALRAAKMEPAGLCVAADFRLPGAA